jgi:tetratricopeptide (TPR) repeat protein
MFHVYLGLFLAARNRVEEAAACLAKGIDLDPLSPFVHGTGAIAMFATRKYEAAIRLGERALELQSDYPPGLWYIGLACCKLARYGRGIEVLERLGIISKRRPSSLGTLGMAYALAGRRSDALALRDELVRRSYDEYVVPISVLLIDLGLGDATKSTKICKRASPIWLADLSWRRWFGSFLDPLDAEPRFNETFRRLRFVQPRPVP